jgi:hypothetical protein
MGGLLVAISVLFTPAGGSYFSLSDPVFASIWRFFFPSNHKRKTAKRPTIAMIPMARPAFAPVERPLLDELVESAEELAEAEAAATEPVLVLPMMPAEVVDTRVVGAIKDAEVGVVSAEDSTVGEEETVATAGAESVVVT